MQELPHLALIIHLVRRAREPRLQLDYKYPQNEQVMLIHEQGRDAPRAHRDFRYEISLEFQFRSLT